jgi:hypothetical protein
MENAIYSSPRSSPIDIPVRRKKRPVVMDDFEADYGFDNNIGSSDSASIFVMSPPEPQPSMHEIEDKDDYDGIVFGGRGQYAAHHRGHVRRVTYPVYHSFDDPVSSTSYESPSIREPFMYSFPALPTRTRTRSSPDPGKFKASSPDHINDTFGSSSSTAQFTGGNTRPVHSAMYDRLVHSSSSGWFDDELSSSDSDCSSSASDFFFVDALPTPPASGPDAHKGIGMEHMTLTSGSYWPELRTPLRSGHMESYNDKPARGRIVAKGGHLDEYL